MGDFDGHPFRGNQHTSSGHEQGREDAKQILRGPSRPGIGGKRREPAEELRAQAAYHLRMADEQLRDKSAPEHIRVAAAQYSTGRAEGLATAAKEYEAQASRGVTVSKGDYKEREKAWLAHALQRTRAARR